MAWTRRGVLVAGAIGAAAPSIAWGHPPGPALWAVRDGHAEVYLFGDSAPMRTPWRSPRIEGALAESATYWKEVPDNGPESTPLVLAAGVDPAAPLSTWLSPKDRLRVTTAAAILGVPTVFLERAKPWLAAQVLESAFYAHYGFKDGDSGEAVLTALAKTAGKPIRTEFPDMAAVVALAAGFSRNASVQSLRLMLDNLEAGPDRLVRSDAAWLSGDLSTPTDDVNRWRRRYPDFYRENLVARNRRWPARFRAMLNGGGVSFVVIGADHLVGQDSVLVELAAAGMDARRV